MDYELSIRTCILATLPHNCKISSMLSADTYKNQKLQSELWINKLICMPFLNVLDR